MEFLCQTDLTQSRASAKVMKHLGLGVATLTGHSGFVQTGRIHHSKNTTFSGNPKQVQYQKILKA